MGWRIGLLSCLFAFSALAADVNGTWTVKFLGDPGNSPKTVDKMTFELEAHGHALMGEAHIGDWPGEAPITEGKVDGDRITFVIVGNSPWKARSRKAGASGFPRLKFTGMIRGDEIELHVVWDS